MRKAVFHIALLTFLLFAPGAHGANEARGDGHGAQEGPGGHSMKTGDTAPGTDMDMSGDAASSGHGDGMSGHTKHVTPKKTKKNAAKAAEAAVGRRIGDFTLVNQHGESFTVKGMLDKPLVVSYIYTHCPHICPTIMANLKSTFGQAGADFGNRFRSLTIGFDVENDTPQALHEYGRHFTDDFSAWSFATAGQDTIDALTDEFGFYYEEKPGGGFDHLNLVTVINTDGRIFTQVYGTDFDQDRLLGSVRRAIAGKERLTNPTSLINRVKLFCYRYDETTGTYKLDYGAVFTLVMVSIFNAATIGWIIYAIRSSRRQART